MTDTGRNDPNHPGKNADETKPPKPAQTHDDGGLTPKDSRNVTGTAVVEDGRWTGASVHPEEGPKVPEPKD
ncbi:hypothetical protein [Blastomonas sp.]|uniref:hypothetical protein n=1 Tax=Blastomonas sp. TaxID=1909299 RepID=UPI002628DE13|nr:hypothetical protein [Blastomonas sp.]MDM7957707.1 hypothetical protein [Blastomonas sp.]